MYGRYSQPYSLAGSSDFLSVMQQLVMLWCVQDVPSSWNASVCFNFCDKFLQHVKDTVQVDYDR